MKKDERDWREEEYRFGKEICREDTQVFLAYLEKEKRQYVQILEKMEQAPGNDRSKQRIAQINEEMACLERRWQMIAN